MAGVVIFCVDKCGKFKTPYWTGQAVMRCLVCAWNVTCLLVTFWIIHFLLPMIQSLYLDKHSLNPWTTGLNPSHHSTTSYFPWIRGSGELLDIMAWISSPRYLSKASFGPKYCLGRIFWTPNPRLCIQELLGCVDMRYMWWQCRSPIPLFDTEKTQPQPIKFV